MYSPEEIRNMILKTAKILIAPKIGKAGIIIIAFSILINILSKTVGYFSFVTSESIDGRYFFVNMLDKQIKKGDYVVFSFKGSEYYEKGTRMVKIATCLPGDYLEVIERDFYCNGIYIGTAKTKDKKGRDVVPFEFQGEIPEGKYFVLGVHKDSYDSRYWGFVDQKEIIGKAYKIF